MKTTSITWVPVETALPECGIEVLLSDGDCVEKGMMRNRFDGLVWMEERGEYVLKNITHWANLPKMPHEITED